MPSPTHRTLPPPSVAFTVWGLGAALYFVGFFHRVAPAVITRELIAEFSLSAAALGNLSAFYFYSYVAVQIPTGVLADRFGPRRILAAGALIAALGGVLFASAASLPLVALGRLLIGGSVGVAFVAMMKLSTHWFPPSRFAAVTGLALGTGLVGAISAGAPLRWLVDAYGWRAVMLGMAAVTALIALAIWFVVRDDPAERGYVSYLPDAHAQRRGRSMLGGLARAMRERNVWLVLIINGGVSGPPLTFGGLWGVPFLATHYGLSTATAAAYCSLLLFAWAAGGPLLGALSDRYGARKPLYSLGILVAAAGWALVFLVPRMPLPLLAFVLTLTGAASGAIMVGFAYAKESTPAALAGTTGGLINMGNMTGGMVMQPAVGWVLDRMWSGPSVAGARVYEFAAYRAGFALMLAWLVVAFILALLTRETHCRQHP